MLKDFPVHMLWVSGALRLARLSLASFLRMVTA